MAEDRPTAEESDGAEPDSDLEDLPVDSEDATNVS